MIKISNICLHQNSIFIKFLKILKIHEIFCENPRIIFVLFYDVHKENMSTINLEDGREAPYKASIDKKSDNFVFNIKFGLLYMIQYTQNYIDTNLIFIYRIKNLTLKTTVNSFSKPILRLNSGFD